MKILILLLLALPATAQKPVSELDSTAAGYFYKMVPSYQGGGRTDTIRAYVSPEIINDLKLTDSKLFVLSLTTNRKAVGTLKEQSSYRVGEKFNIYRIKNEIKYSWEYYGQNAYGAEKKNTIVVTFDEKGTFKSQVVL